MGKLQANKNLTLFTRSQYQSTLVQLCSEKKRKGGGKKKLYITLSRQNRRLSYHNQSVNLVSFHNAKTSPTKSPKNGNPSPIDGRHSPELARPPESTVVFYRGTELPQQPNEAKILKITTLIKEAPPVRSRGSSSSSQVTLTTSYSKIDDEGNNNSKPSCYGKAVVDGKRKCRCWNCERKRGINSLRNKCLFKKKTQSATLESIVKKMGFLPRRSSKDGGSNHEAKKLKLTKTLSSYTISNSSLQDLDESEFTSSELADIMGQMKHGQEVQV